MADKKINLSLGMPAVATDGNALTIRDNGDASLVFFQINPQENQASEEIAAIGVAHVRMKLEELKALDEAIHKTIEQHEAKKKQIK